ncbi:MAG: radical SAM family heme chaperone HemW [Oceanococcus sp.]
MLPLSLYIHIPWCVRKCPYCDFNSHTGQPQEQAYVEALSRDLEFELNQRPHWPEIESIFIGGGTPSLFSGDAIQAILDNVRLRLNVSADTEITLEANPGTADAANFAGYRKAGVNRLSIGVQSFNDSHLLKLGRIHQGSTAIDAFHMARAAGFDNINLDLMHGLPTQLNEQALSDLNTALALNPEHLSWYQLTIEAGTAFGQNPPQLPDDDERADTEDAGLLLLQAAGYRRYEISAFARSRRRARHNLNYWKFGDYLGIGAGAHGKLTGPDGVIRRARLRSPGKYLSHAGSAEALARVSSPSQSELISEFALNTLRINGAFTRERFERRTGLDYSTLKPALKEAESLGLITFRYGELKKTILGQRHLNRLLECFAEMPSIQ